MSGVAVIHFDRNVFRNANWKAAIADNQKYGYSTVWLHLNAEAIFCEERRDSASAECLKLLAFPCPMMLEACSVNEPF